MELDHKLRPFEHKREETIIWLMLEAHYLIFLECQEISVKGVDAVEIRFEQ